MYATGGVIGVFKAPSPATPGVCGRRLKVADMGERGSSDGNAGDLREVGTALAMPDVDMLASFVDVVSGGEGRAAGALSAFALDSVMIGIGAVAASAIVAEGGVIWGRRWALLWQLCGCGKTSVRRSDRFEPSSERAGRQQKTGEKMFFCYLLPHKPGGGGVGGGI